MIINTNFWNRVRYTLYTPFYDRVIRTFDASRRCAIDLLALQSGEHVLIVGAGTGEDLRYMPEGVEVTAIDITPAMVEQIRCKAVALDQTVTALVMDGQSLTFPSEQFDAVVLNLIIAVIPDPNACMREAARVLKPNGRIVVFDKFLDDNQQPSFVRNLANFLARIAATNLNRQLKPISAQASLCIEHEERAARFAQLGFRVALLRKCP
ncbi:MAG: class I SAM-dependent methyltransferase [Anaerolinea sp.]|nr:class I SAM-dependent methyltransferase [Anaerolinea sp.]